jgi:hypothetical protein
VQPDAERWDRLCEGCLGEGCQGCKKGWIKESQRPAGLITEEGESLFQAYQWLKNYGQMPAPGGFLQQSAAFVDAVAWCDTVHSAFARARERRNADVSKLHASLQKMTGKHASR